VIGVHPEAAKGVRPMTTAMRILLRRDMAYSVLSSGLCRASQLYVCLGQEKSAFAENVRKD
jgi:hypothetical protein